MPENSRLIQRFDIPTRSRPHILAALTYLNLASALPQNPHHQPTILQRSIVRQLPGLQCSVYRITLSRLLSNCHTTMGSRIAKVV